MLLLAFKNDNELKTKITAIHIYRIVLGHSTICHKEEE